MHLPSTFQPRVRPAAILLLALLMSPLAAADQALPATPEQRTDEAAVARHAEYLARAAAGGGDLLFLGDSITDFFRNAGAWGQRLAPLGAVDFGMWGDGTQHLLWRLGNGELRGLAPRVVVLMIGTNNLGRGFTTAAVVAGVAANLKLVTTTFPQARVVLMAVLPQDHASAEASAEITAINRQLATLSDGQRVRFLDIGEQLRGPDGGIRAGLYRDNIHPADPGYTEWAEALLPVLTELGLGAKP